MTGVMRPHEPDVSLGPDHVSSDVGFGFAFWVLMLDARQHLRRDTAKVSLSDAQSLVEGA